MANTFNPSLSYTFKKPQTWQEYLAANSKKKPESTNTNLVQNPVKEVVKEESKVAQPTANDAYKASLDNDVNAYNTNMGIDVNLLKGAYEDAVVGADTDYALKKSNLEKQRNNAEKLKESTIQNYKLNSDTFKKQVQSAKDSAETTTGTALRQQAISNRRAAGQLANKWASRGMIDSQGAGSYGAAESQLNDEQAIAQNNIIEKKLSYIKELDNELLNDERNTKNLIDKTVSEFEQAILTIDNNIASSDAEKIAAKKQAYNTYLSNLTKIDNDYRTKNSAVMKAKADLETELAKSKNTGSLEATKGTDTLRNEFITRVEKTGYPEVALAVKKIINSSGNGIGDLNTLVGFMKLIDPTTGVREGELQLGASANTGLGQRAQQYFAELQGNKLRPETREAFKQEALAVLSQYENAVKNYRDYYGNLAKQRGINPNDVVNVFGDVSSLAPQVIQVGNYQVEVE